MAKLYPLRKEYRAHDLAVDGLHTLHIREYGKRDGIPAVFLHGGPGSGCQPEHARFFSPDYYRIILFDQRGAGLSTPAGELEANTTQHLVADLEAIREYLQIDRWLLFAGSWGATLALMYAITHPASVMGMILRGVFLARQKDLDWFFGSEGVARIFPREWDAFSGWLPETKQKDLVAAYLHCLQGNDQEQISRAVNAWSAWGDAVVTNGASTKKQERPKDGRVANGLLAKTRIEVHYACQRYFLAENFLLEQTGRLPEVPVSIVHGKHDLVCPFEAAWTLHRAISGSRLVTVDSGHLASEPAMASALVRETEQLISSVQYP